MPLPLGGTTARPPASPPRPSPVPGRPPAAFPPGPRTSPPPAFACSPPPNITPWKPAVTDHSTTSPSLTETSVCDQRFGPVRPSIFFASAAADLFPGWSSGRPIAAVRENNVATNSNDLRRISDLLVEREYLR